MDLKKRVQRLQSLQDSLVEPLTKEQRLRLHELEQIAANHSDRNDYDVLEHLELHIASRPGLTFEQYLRESEAIRV